VNPRETTPVDLGLLQQWLGRTERRVDVVSAAPLAALAATLDRDEPLPVPGAPVPPLWHWLYFTPIACQSEIGADGHPRRGGFLPPVPLPRRMWAGGRLEFLQPLLVGDAITRASRIVKIDAKSGRSGELVFVTVRHEYSTPRGAAMTEEHDIVYRDLPAPGAPAPTPQAAPNDAGFSRGVNPDPVLLFRYSALTFNGHRIHYDRPYVTQVEGYPGLIVHGPLIATLLADLLRREIPRARLRKFAFTAMRPIFDIHRFSVCGRVDASGSLAGAGGQGGSRTGGEPGAAGNTPAVHKVALWARDHEGFLAMQAQAELA
jgi:3-methylfumaryl-CoA hydratase